MAKLIMTVKQMADREAWLNLRETGIGGSDASVVVGLNAWKSPFELWMEKTGQKEAEDLSGNEAVYWGTQLEDMVAREFSKRTGKKVQRYGVLQHEEYPFLLASIDRRILGENAGLECKTASGYHGREWADDEIPDAYYVQCQHYLAVTGWDRWYIACLIGGQRFVWKTVERNEDDIAALIQAETEFWDKVKWMEMPSVDGTNSCTKALSEKFKGGGDEIDLPKDAEEAVRLIDELETVKKDVEGKIELHRNTLRQMLGDAEAGTTPDGRHVTWKTQAGRWTVDGKRLKEEKPEVYAEYAKQGKPIRVLKIAG